MTPSKSNNFSRSFISATFARGGSKGLIGKNSRNFCGRPLIEWTIEQAISLSFVKKHYVSTDDDTIAQLALNAGAEVPFLRPAHLSTDTSPELDSWKHLVNHLLTNGDIKMTDALVVLPCTSPNRKLSDIKRAVNLFNSDLFDLVLGVAPSSKHPDFNMVVKDQKGLVTLAGNKDSKVSRRQDTKPLFDITTCFYISSIENVLQCDSLFSGRVGAVEVQREFAVDIDTELDFKISEFLFGGKSD